MQARQLDAIRALSTIEGFMRRELHPSDDKKLNEEMVYLTDFLINLDVQDVPKQTLNVPITEHDLDLLRDVVYNGETINWSFDTDKGLSINLILMDQDAFDEYEGRKKNE